MFTWTERRTLVRYGLHRYCVKRNHQYDLMAPYCDDNILVLYTRVFGTLAGKANQICVAPCWDTSIELLILLTIFCEALRCCLFPSLRHFRSYSTVTSAWLPSCLPTALRETQSKATTACGLSFGASFLTKHDASKRQYSSPSPSDAASVLRGRAVNGQCPRCELPAPLTQARAYVCPCGVQ